MERTHPATNHQDSSPVPQPSTSSYSTERALPAGHMGPELGKTEPKHFGVDVHLQHPQPHPYLLHPTQSLNMHEAVQIEIEKELIRAEIIMSEIVRRRMEAEMRRELMMIDRELDLQRSSNGFPFGSSPAMGFNSPYLGTTSEGRCLGERIVLDRSLENGETETPPFQGGTSALGISGVKPAPVKEGGKEKEKNIVLAEPFENMSGSKRMGVTPRPGGNVNEFPSDGILKKKVKVEWSCGLCQVDVNNERVLNEHLRGKKHKAKEAALANTAGKNSSIRLLTKNTTKSIPVAGALNTGKEAEPYENMSGSKRMGVTPRPGGNVDEFPSDGILKKKAEVEWNCGLCQVDVNNERVLNEHLRGKKHKAKEAALANMAGKNLSMRLLTKNTTKSIAVAEALNTSKEASSKCNNLQGNLNSDNLKKHELVEVHEVQKNGDLDNKKHEFWCEMCQIGVSSEKVMNAHINGKKHVRRLLRRNGNGGAGPSDQKSIKLEDDQFVNETKPDEDMNKPNVGDALKVDEMAVS